MRRFVLGTLLACGLGQAVFAQPADVAARIAALGRINSASAPSFAPDGRRFAFLSNEGSSPQVWVQDAGTGEPRQLTRLADPVTSVFWSPRGDLIAYAVAPGGGLNTQLWVMKPDGTAARRLTPGGRDNNGLSGWTHDGTALMVDTNKDHPGARDPALLDVATGQWRMLAADKGLNTIADVRGAAAVVLRVVGRGDANAYRVDVVSGRETPLSPHNGKAETGWGQMSPDGRAVYVTSDVGRDRAAFGTVAIDAAGRAGPIRYFATRDDAVAADGLLSDDGRTAALAWNVGGRTKMALYDTASRRVRPLSLPIDYGAPVDFSREGATLAIAGGAADRTGDIYLVDVATGAVTRATQSRHDGVDLAALIKPELVSYRGADGVPMSGWLYRPAGATTPMPVVFSYHGGPEGQAIPSMSPDAQALAMRGIATFAPNVRGSSGFGKAFMALDDGAKRVDGVRDIKATTDALVAMGIADPKRLGIMGGSYGGYMVMAGVTQYPTMFAAAADLYGVVNFETFFRETEPWMAAISTTEYGDPRTQAAMLRDLSPIHRIDRVTTPLFVLHGANDTNVPVVEARQIVDSLKARGVPVRFTLFPDEGHGWRKTANRVRSTIEITDFFAQYLGKPAS
ncbi:S9 family peptidase [Sphingomonas bacterium]|uniref:S9 family peptidase n=1 Tax=Sphingomonas bacterium TaxID=1895847 RepID=UPI00157570C9|nr:S9 family peptidase [Sphingomonas bacterium]